MYKHLTKRLFLKHQVSTNRLARKELKLEAELEASAETAADDAFSSDLDNLCVF